jgi:alpha-beta hydrolase superfamily lysophospholipase
MAAPGCPVNDVNRKPVCASVPVRSRVAARLSRTHRHPSPAASLPRLTLPGQRADTLACAVRSHHETPRCADASPIDVVPAARLIAYLETR